MLESWLLSIWLMCISSYCSLQWCERTAARWPFTLAYHVIFKCPVTRIAKKTAAASSMALQSQISNMLGSITCTTVPCDIHQWYNDILSSVEHGSKQPQGADIKVPDASSNYDDYISIGMKKSVLMGMHGHGFCCEKGKRGKYMCCLVFKWGLHTWNTCPLLIILFRLKNIAKKQHADFRAFPMDEYTISMLNAPWLVNLYISIL